MREKLITQWLWLGQAPSALTPKRNDSARRSSTETSSLVRPSRRLRRHRTEADDGEPEEQAADRITDYGASLLSPFIEAGDAKWAFSELSPKRHDASAPPTS
jgi:hypothetical protein